MKREACQVKRGFFVLRDCGKAAQTTCTECRRQVCEEHSTMGARGGGCVDCAARQSSAGAGPEEVYTYRHHYYQSNQYQPIYGGYNYDTYYDMYDVRSFEPGPDADVDEEFEDSRFGDS